MASSGEGDRKGGMRFALNQSAAVPAAPVVIAHGGLPPHFPNAGPGITISSAGRIGAPMETRSSRYHDVYARWQRDPEGFWAEAAQDIDWFEPATRLLDPAAGVYGRWFAGAVCNTCWNAVDRHVRDGRGSQPAITYDSPLAGTKLTITYDRLLSEPH